MKNKILHNPTNADILDYRISEAKLDSNGNVVRDNQGHIVSTDITREWSLAGALSRNKEELERKNILDTMEFPEYVADYLMNVYSFLEVKEAKEEPQKERVSGSVEAPVENQDIPNIEPTCQTCKKTFKSFMGLGVHMDKMHVEKTS